LSSERYLPEIDMRGVGDQIDCHAAALGMLLPYKVALERNLSKCGDEQYLFRLSFPVGHLVFPLAGESASLSSISI